MNNLENGFKFVFMEQINMTNHLILNDQPLITFKMVSWDFENVYTKSVKTSNVPNRFHLFIKSYSQFGCTL